MLKKIAEKIKTQKSEKDVGGIVPPLPVGEYTAEKAEEEVCVVEDPRSHLEKMNAPPDPDEEARFKNRG